jgi:uncharacterized protein YndB with AHSA1/START domain
MRSHSYRSVKISWRFSVPPGRVWKAWTDPELLKQWFGSDPNGSVISATVDLRINGSFEVAFMNSDNTGHTCMGTYREIDPNRKLVFTWTWKERPGVVELVTVLLEKDHDGTVMSFKHAEIDPGTTHDYEVGWKRTFEKLQNVLT